MISAPARFGKYRINILPEETQPELVEIEIYGVPVARQNIPAKKVQVGDIDIAYKTFGKGNPILLINGYSFAMDSWDPTLLETLASNHTVIVFNNRGIGNTTSGNGQNFSIEQFANDTY